MYRLVKKYGIHCHMCKKISEKLYKNETLMEAEKYHIDADLPALISIRKTKNISKLANTKLEISKDSTVPKTPATNKEFLLFGKKVNEYCD